MKSYYQILQVDPQAELEVIEAAYRRLMQKYHPDVLSPNERQSEEALRKAQELNEAHAVLSDSAKRQAYDLSRADEASAAQAVAAPRPSAIALETRIYLVRCSTTRQTFKLHLGRRVGWHGPFVALSLEVIPSLAPEPARGWWDRLQADLAAWRKPSRAPDVAMAASPDETLQNLLDEANTLSLGEIDWAGHKCPACAGEVTNPNGTRGTWSMCGTCHRLKCVGNSKRRLDGYYMTCPWCGAWNKLTRSIATGAKDQAIVRGKYSETTKLDRSRLDDAAPKSLGTKKDPQDR